MGASCWYCAEQPLKQRRKSVECTHTYRQTDRQKALLQHLHHVKEGRKTILKFIYPSASTMCLKWNSTCLYLAEVSLVSICRPISLIYPSVPLPHLLLSMFHPVCLSLSLFLFLFLRQIKLYGRENVN